MSQDESLRKAILNKKARIVEIERTLNAPRPTEHRGRPVSGGKGWRRRLEEERQQLLVAVAELAAELERTLSSAQNDTGRTPSPFLNKLLAYLAVQPLEWPGNPDALPYVKELVEIESDYKIQWDTAADGADALESQLRRRRDELIETIRRDYPETAKKLLLEGSEWRKAEINSREEFLRSILIEKGFSVHDWASAAKVDFHTANDFLHGKTNPHPATFKKLADALGVEVSKLKSLPR
jgi:hypothetical protein